MLQYDGILLCDKPYGITSHDLISDLRHIIGQKRIGHLGTLDPRATGLMVICLGRATKIAQFLADIDKTYEAEITLGIRSVTFDSEGVTDNVGSSTIPDLSEEEVDKILGEFRGRIIQKVPAFSAVKQGGERLYKMARRGEEVTTPEREVEIMEIALTRLALPVIAFTVSCSRGTYIRALANDIGEKIGCGAYLSRLNRTRVGEFELKDSLSPNEINHYREAGILKRYIRPIESILSFPSIRVSESFSPSIVSGRPLRAKDVVDINGRFAPDDYISLMDYSGRIMAVGKAGADSSEIDRVQEKEFFKYVRVLN